jgi:hypothetical protein
MSYNKIYPKYFVIILKKGKHGKKKGREKSELRKSFVENIDQDNHRGEPEYFENN